MKLDGAELRSGVADVEALESVLGELSPEAGLRLHGVPGLEALLRDDSIGRPVRAIFFDKTRESNWSLDWHQDRVIAVKHRVETPGFGPWTVKAGLHHVAPPIGLLARMVTLRIHLDEVTHENAPLIIAPGSHRLGRIHEAEIRDVVAKCGTFTCLARRGDVWKYATPILHASAASTSLRRRRVLQVDYSADALPNGLQWLGL